MPNSNLRCTPLISLLLCWSIYLFFSFQNTNNNNNNVKNDMSRSYDVFLYMIKNQQIFMTITNTTISIQAFETYYLRS